MIERRYGSGPERPSPRAMLIRALLLVGALVAVVLLSNRAGNSMASCLAFFGNG